MLCFSRCLAGVALMPAFAQGVPIVLPPDPPMGTVYWLSLPGTDRVAQPHLRGDVLEDEVHPVSYGYCPVGGGGSCYHVTGWLQQRVVRSHVDRTIDFHWRFQLGVVPPGEEPHWGSVADAASFVSIRSAFDPRFRYDANWLVDEGGTPHRRLNVIGDVAMYEWLRHGDMRLPAQAHLGRGSSAWFVLDTDAPAYARTAWVTVDSTSVYDQAGDNGMTAFAPAVPEPATLALAAGGLALLGLRPARCGTRSRHLGWAPRSTAEQAA